MYYYELLHVIPRTKALPALWPGIYCDTAEPSNLPMLAGDAQRIWHVIDGKVVYKKHRKSGQEVDMKEFTWIKLTAKEIG